ncbi:hypothetical protein C1H46_019540 [Malus baccata]|uniref:Uncharacterized protein n=1 Tax=Malus baccata TaxID=106549 RepID=A0A540M7W3_MALBA|nr:hypothetical protein C1H46_019540 [Malus baccata]
MPESVPWKTGEMVNLERVREDKGKGVGEVEDVRVGALGHGGVGGRGEGYDADVLDGDVG